MEVKDWIASSWVAASFVTLVGLGIGALVGPKPAAPGAGVVALVGFRIPNCGVSATEDQIDGDIGIPEKQATPVGLDRLLCAGEKIHWHDQLRRPFTVVFTSTDCTSNPTPPPASVPATGDSFLDVTTLPLSSSPTGTYRYCAYNFGGLGFHNYPPAHIIIMK